MGLKLFVIHFVLVSSLFQSRLSQNLLPPRPIQVHNLLRMQKGLGWPHDLQVVVGHEALLKIERDWDSYDTCEITNPTGAKFDVGSPPNNRFERWGGGCGLRIRNVEKSDQGRWRLTTSKGNDTALGWTQLHVTDETSEYSAEAISLHDGQTDTQVVLTSLDNSYCVVTQPFSESSLVPGHCQVTLGRTSRAVQGNWNVLLGLPGRVNELQVQRKVAVEAERLDVGYIRDSNTNKLHLYCNLLHTTKNVTFCRFQKTSRPAGFNVIDGLSDGTHSYYGDGFFERQCGLTIEQPSTQDDGTWRCSVGVQQWVGTTIQQQTPLQALISVGPDTTGMGSRRSTDEYSRNEIETVFVQEDFTFTVMCRADVSLAYCWFQHPNGTQFTPMPLTNEDQPYWYTGQNLQVGDCGISFSHATRAEGGVWNCHMGPGNQVGLEQTNRIEVRVTGPLAANKREIATNIGDSITIYCHSSNGNRPLDYCRFLKPTSQGFRIDSSVTEENAILGRYYFTPGRNLDYGDCSLTIKEVHEEDLGEWTCAALLNDESFESRDTVKVYIEETVTPPGLSQAGIVGMVIGLFGLGVILAAVLIYKRGWISNTRNTPSNSSSPVEIIDMLDIPRSSSVEQSQSQQTQLSQGSISQSSHSSHVSQESSENDIAIVQRD